MGPYNYPLNETFATLIPALIMGNTVVFKPPQFGTLLFEPLLEAFRSAFPEGRHQHRLRPGAVVVPRLLDSGKVNVLTLIGSSKVADHLKKHAPEGRTACAPSSGSTPRTPRSSCPTPTSNSR